MIEMKKKVAGLLVLIMIFAFLVTDAFARTGSRRSTIRVYGTTGGAAGDLDAVECEDIRGDDAAITDPLRDDDVAWGVITTAGAHPQIYFWAFDEDVDNDNCTAANEPWDCCTGSGTGNCEAADEDDPRLIFPDDQADCTVTANEGAWVLAETYYLGRVAAPSVVFRDADASDTDVNAQIDVNCTDTGSGTEDCDMYARVQVGGSLTTIYQLDADGNIEMAYDIDLASGKVYKINGSQIDIGDLAAGGDWTPTGTIDLSSSTDTTYKDGTVDAADLADADFGDFTVATGSATLDNDVVSTDEIATDAVTMDSVDADGTFTSLTGAWATTGLLSGGVITNSKSANYTVGTDSSAECYGGIIYVTSTCDITACDNLAAGMSFTVITIGATQVDVDVQSDDLMYLDGTALDDGDKAVNGSAAGDMIVCTYYDATGWACQSNDWTDGG